jgi:hypothetical protein
MLVGMSQPPGLQTDRRPRHRFLFAAGVVLVTTGLACLALSAFAESAIVNGLTSVVLPGALMLVPGWSGFQR